MKLLSAIATSLLVAYAAADCPNACSGHGLCTSNNQCKCDPNYMGADCSQRSCQFDYAFVDTPRGDLNHNGLIDQGSSGYTKVQWSNVQEYEMFPTNAAIYAASNDEAHFYAECSGKGLCQRDTGVCQCFPGYTGAACQRTRCPNDCSANGVCRTLREIAAGGLNKFEYQSVGGHKYFSGVRTPFDYRRWDADKHQSCVCDPGFTGPDCSQRLCPRGDDPLTNGNRWCGGGTCTWEIQSFTVADNGNSTYKLGFTDQFNGTSYTYVTIDTATGNNGYIAPNQQGQFVPGPLTMAGRIMNALRSIPGGALQRVEVFPRGDPQATPNADSTRTFAITFVGVSGNVAPISVQAASATASLWYNPDHPEYNAVNPVEASRAIVEVANGNYEDFECSGRGLCDRTAGLCKCFPGYTGESCSIQDALSM